MKKSVITDSRTELRKKWGLVRKAKKITPHHCTMVGFINYHQKNIIFRARIVHQLTLSPSGTLLFCGLPIMFWQKKSAENFWVLQYWKAIEKKSWNQSVKKVTQMIWKNLFLAHTFLEEAVLKNTVKNRLKQQKTMLIVLSSFLSIIRKETLSFWMKFVISTTVHCQVNRDRFFDIWILWIMVRHLKTWIWAQKSRKKEDVSSLSPKKFALSDQIVDYLSTY